MDRTIDGLQRWAAARPEAISLGGGLPAQELFPTDALARASARAIAVGSASSLQYGWPEGTPGLRAWIAARLRARGAHVSADDVIVTAGAQQAIAVAADTLLGEGARVNVDEHSYPAALELFRALGATPTTQVAGASAAYLMAGITNPHGREPSAARKEELDGASLPLVVDEAYTELVFDGRVAEPMLARAPHRVWHVGTFSKTLCPGLRIGWLVAPRDRREDALRAKRDADLQANSLSQSILEVLFSRFDLDAHLERARCVYARRAARLMEALRARLPAWRFEEPRGGFSVFVETGEPGDDRAFLATATAHGVAFDPGRMFRPDERSGTIALRLCYSNAPETELAEAVRRLARAWDVHRGASPKAHAV